MKRMKLIEKAIFGMMSESSGPKESERIGGLEKLLATLPANRSIEPNSLVVCVSSEQRDELLATDPDVYYLTEHYEGYDNVLVRLSQITTEALQGLLMMSHKYRTSSSRRTTR